MAAAKSSPSGAVRCGVGGWTYEPWRNNFYPAGLAHSKELQYASRQLTAIEVNGTYYSTFKPPTFAKWRDETPDGFVFSLKANRFATNRKVLAEAGPSVQRFVDSGIAELGDKLGPIVWQFAPTKLFDPEDFGAFLELLPKDAGGIALRHALDVRHPSFMAPDYLALARRHGCATVFTDSDDYPSFADLTGGVALWAAASNQNAGGCRPRCASQAPKSCCVMNSSNSACGSGTAARSTTSVKCRNADARMKIGNPPSRATYPTNGSPRSSNVPWCVQRGSTLCRRRPSRTTPRASARATISSCCSVSRAHCVTTSQKR